MEHTITLSPSGHSFRCAQDTPILTAGLAAGLFIPYSCRSGVCNTCRGRVRAGRVEFGAAHPAHLNEADRADGWVMLCQARPSSDVAIDVRELDPSEALAPKALPARVIELEKLAPDVLKVVLGLPANEPLLFHAGQYLEVVTRDGTRRNYSMANAAEPGGARRLELHVRRHPGGTFTEHLFGRTQLRDIWQINVPLGAFYLREQSERPIVLLAAGTGFAPIKALVEHSLRTGLARPMHLYWGGRTSADLYMRDLAESWARDHAHIRFTPVLSEPTAPCAWSGRTGFVHRAVMQDHPDLGAFQVYACGAPIVIDRARADFTNDCGLPPDEFFADSFVTSAEKAMDAPTAKGTTHAS